MCYHLNVVILKNRRVFNALKILSLQVNRLQLGRHFKSVVPDSPHTIPLTLNLDCVGDCDGFAIRCLAHDSATLVKYIGDTVLLDLRAMPKLVRHGVRGRGEHCERENENGEDTGEILHGVSLLSGSIWQLEYYSLWLKCASPSQNLHIWGRLRKLTMVNFNSKKEGRYPPPFLVPRPRVRRPFPSPAHTPITKSPIKVRRVIFTSHSLQ